MSNTLILNTNKFNIGTMQDQIEDSLKSASQLGRKAILAYTGLLGLTYDLLTSTWQERDAFLRKAEKRGQQIENEVLSQVNNVSKDVTAVVERVQANAQKFLRTASQPVTISPADSTAEVKIDRAPLAQVVAKAKKAVSKPNASKKSAPHSEIAIAGDVVAIAGSEPLAGYAAMNVDTVVQNLRTLSNEVLLAVREYEAANKQRVGVLRFIDERLQQKQPQGE